MKKGKEKCDCIFCISKCPDCGSTDIEVDFSASYNYDNAIDDTIVISLQNVCEITIRCHACNSEFQDIDGLEDKLHKALPDQVECAYEDHEITYLPLYVRSELED